MQEFSYSLTYKFIYRYGNVVATILMAGYLIPLAIGIDQNLWLLIPLILILLLIYFINRKYLEMYKIVPYKISADENKMHCTNFIFSKREITIYYKDIESLTGGIFDGKWFGLMKVCDGKNQICIGFFDKLKDSQKLITLILSKVDKKIYDDVMEKIKSLRNPSAKS